MRDDGELRTHKDLDAWRRSLDLVEVVYKVTKEFPQEELYGLTNQLRRAVVSVPSNIAEGAARGSQKEFLQFLHIALGSVSEVETQLAIACPVKWWESGLFHEACPVQSSGSHLFHGAKRLGYLDNVDSIEEQIQTVRKLILGLIRYLRARDGKR